MNHKASVNFLVIHLPKALIAFGLTLAVVWGKIQWDQTIDQFSSVPMTSMAVLLETRAQLPVIKSTNNITSSAQNLVQVTEENEWRQRLSKVIMPAQIVSQNDYAQLLWFLAAQGDWRELDQHLRLGQPRCKDLGKALELALLSRDLRKVSLLLTPMFHYDQEQTKLAWKILAKEVQYSVERGDEWHFAGLMETTALMAKHLPSVNSPEAELLMKRMVAMNQQLERGPADVFSGRL